MVQSLQRYFFNWTISKKCKKEKWNWRVERSGLPSTCCKHEMFKTQALGRPGYQWHLPTSPFGPVSPGKCHCCGKWMAAAHSLVILDYLQFTIWQYVIQYVHIWPYMIMCVLYYMNVTLCISIWRHSFTLIQRNLKSILSCLKCDLLNSIAELCAVRKSIEKTNADFQSSMPKHDSIAKRIRSNRPFHLYQYQAAHEMHPDVGACVR